MKPEHALGADMIWWRREHGMRTVVTVFWDHYADFPEPVHLQARLFDKQGRMQAQWRIDISPGQPIFIDSAAPGPWREAGAQDGLLTLYACTLNSPGEAARNRYIRLYPMVDWHLGNGQMSSLHSDQCIVRGFEGIQRFTEIAAPETTSLRHRLVILNGEETQATDALALRLTRPDGASMSAHYGAPMPPHSVHCIALTDLVPGLAEFASGQPLSVSGEFASSGIYTRPYVETLGERWGIFHGGDVYEWQPLAPHVAAMIDGEVNPVAVLHDGDTRTRIHVFNSHGDVELDVPVDARLYDEAGNCVAERENWLTARRYALDSADVAELLPENCDRFIGHLALRFSPRHRGPIPRRQQTLAEYLSPGHRANVMAWSDEWNSRIRVAKRQRTASVTPLRACFRVYADSENVTLLAISNPGHEQPPPPAKATVLLYSPLGRIGSATLDIAPFGTRLIALPDLFPAALLSQLDGGLGLVVLESESDLASIAFVRHLGSCALAAEHFMAMQSSANGRIVLPAGN